jgi:hypothetical protein
MKENIPGIWFNVYDDEAPKDGKLKVVLAPVGLSGPEMIDTDKKNLDQSDLWKTWNNVAEALPKTTTDPHE